MALRRLVSRKSLMDETTTAVAERDVINVKFCAAALFIYFFAVELRLQVDALNVARIKQPSQWSRLVRNRASYKDIV